MKINITISADMGDGDSQIRIIDSSSIEDAEKQLAAFFDKAKTIAQALAPELPF